MIFFVSITNTFGYYKQARKLIHLFVIAQKLDFGGRGEGTVWNVLLHNSCLIIANNTLSANTAHPSEEIFNLRPFVTSINNTLSDNPPHTYRTFILRPFLQQWYVCVCDQEAEGEKRIVVSPESEYCNARKRL